MPAIQIFYYSNPHINFLTCIAIKQPILCRLWIKIYHSVSTIQMCLWSILCLLFRSHLNSNSNDKRKKKMMFSKQRGINKSIETHEVTWPYPLWHVIVYIFIYARLYPAILDRKKIYCSLALVLNTFRVVYLCFFIT